MVAVAGAGDAPGTAAAGTEDASGGSAAEASAGGDGDRSVAAAAVAGGSGGQSAETGISSDSAAVGAGAASGGDTGGATPSSSPAAAASASKAAPTPAGEVVLEGEALAAAEAAQAATGGVYDEVEIEDMEFDAKDGTYYYPCPCGDRFSITKVGVWLRCSPFASRADDTPCRTSCSTVRTSRGALAARSSSGWCTMWCVVGAALLCMRFRTQHCYRLRRMTCLTARTRASSSSTPTKREGSNSPHVPRIRIALQ